MNEKIKIFIFSLMFVFIEILFLIGYLKVNFDKLNSQGSGSGYIVIFPVFLYIICLFINFILLISISNIKKIKYIFIISIFCSIFIFSSPILLSIDHLSQFMESPIGKIYLMGIIYTYLLTIILSYFYFKSLESNIK